MSGFLVITRKVGQGFYIGDTYVQISRVERGGERVVVAISAPPEITVLREELTKKVSA